MKSSRQKNITQVPDWLSDQDRELPGDIDKIACALPGREQVATILDVGPRELDRFGRIQVHLDLGALSASVIENLECYCCNGSRDICHYRTIWHEMIPFLIQTPPINQGTTLIGRSDEASMMASGARNEAARTRALVKLAPMSRMAWQTAAVGEAIAMTVNSIGVNSLVRVLSALKPVLPSELFNVLRDEALAAARSEVKGRRALALVCVVPLFGEPERSAILAELLTEGRGLETGSSRAEVLAQIVSLLPEEDRNAVTKEVLAAAKGKQSVWTSAEALVSLARMLPEKDRDGVYREAVATLCTIDDAVERGRALERLVKKLPDYLQLVVLDRFLECAGYMQRQELLRLLPDFLPILHSTEGSPGMVELLRSLRDVSQWFY